MANKPSHKNTKKIIKKFVHRLSKFPKSLVAFHLTVIVNGKCKVYASNNSIKNLANDRETFKKELQNYVSSKGNMESDIGDVTPNESTEDDIC